MSGRGIGRCERGTQRATVPTNEAETIARACRGEAAARSALVNLHQALVYSIARHMLGRNEEVGDVFQTVFLKLLEHLDRIDPVIGAAGWLRRTTVNECFDRMKARRDGALPESDNVSGTSSTPVEVAQEHEADVAVRQALQDLSPDYRATVVLHYTEGLSYAEIAEVLDISIETVRSRLKRARSQLRRKLRNYC